MLTPLRARPWVDTETTWLLPVVVTAMEPEKPPPLMASLICVGDASPVTVPEALKVRSSQLPETRLPSEVSLARNSTVFEALAHRKAMDVSARAT